VFGQPCKRQYCPFLHDPGQREGNFGQVVPNADETMMCRWSTCTSRFCQKAHRPGQQVCFQWPCFDRACERQHNQQQSQQSQEKWAGGQSQGAWMNNQPQRVGAVQQFPVVSRAGPVVSQDRMRMIGMSREQMFTSRKRCFNNHEGKVCVSNCPLAHGTAAVGAPKCPRVGNSMCEFFFGRGCWKSH